MLRFLAILSILVSMQTVAFGGSLADQLKNLPLDKAISVGNGSRVVVEFSSPECYFSRRMSIYWSKRTDVTRYVFLVDKNRPDAVQKARYILGAADPGRAYGEVFSGGLDFDENLHERHDDDHGLLAVHRQVVERLGVKITPTYVINGVMIEGARLADIERALGGERIPFEVDEP